MWQLAHCPATVSWLWFHLLGVQPLVLWQLKHPALPTGMCVAPLPGALDPSWQPAQLVLALKPE